MSSPNLSREEKTELKQLSAVYYECLSKNYFPLFISGQNVQLEEVCVDERAKLITIERRLFRNDFANRL